MKSGAILDFSDWSPKKLGNICEIILGQSPPSSTYNTQHIGLPFFQGKAEFTILYPKAIKWCSKPKKIAEPLDILVSVRAPVGSTNIANQKCCIGRGLAAIRYPDCNKFIFYFFRLIEKDLDKLGTGTTFKAISSKTLNELPIPFPPLPVQQIIVAKIEQLFSELDSGVASLKKAKEQIKIYRQTVLASAFSGRLCRNLTCLPDRQVYQIPFGEQKNFINEIPTNSSPDHLNPIQVRNPINKDDLLRVRQEVEIEHLPYKQKTNIAEERIYGIQETTSNNKAAEPQTQYGLSQGSLDSKISSIKSEHKSSESVNLENPGSDNYTSNLPEGWKWVKLGEVVELISGQHILKNNYNYTQEGIPYLTGPIDFGNYFPSISRWTMKPKSIAKKDDILITVKGAGVGKLNISNIDEMAISRQLMAIRSKKYSPLFLFYFLKSKFNKLQKLGIGSTVPGIDRNSILNFMTILPPLEEQTQIVNEIEKRFSEADNLEKAIDVSLTKAVSLRQSILKQAFEGKIIQ